MSDYIKSRYLDVQNEQKNRYTFLGILQGITCDGNITIREVDYIVNWLKQHPIGIDEIPKINKIKDLLNGMLRKQIIVDSEELELKNLLNDISGSQWETNRDTNNMPIKLYAKNPSIVFNNSCFVLTGNFEYGTKKLCENAINSLGGKCESNVTSRTDYLVIGKNGSKDWTHNAWGNKIEKAHETKIPIISEKQWLEALKK
jgi:NAD-dependent DNA ligase